MPLGMFVNPLPGLKASHLLQFDFPSDYRAPDTYPNINIEAPGIEQMYGKLGTPAKEQGHPSLCEQSPVEAEDPNTYPFQDQVVDIDRCVVVHHTARLSGSFARFLASENYQSIVRLDAQPITSGGALIRLTGATGIVATLRPQTPAKNVWFWQNPTTREELIFTANIEFNPRRVGLQAENVYKLIARWEFYDRSITPAERMPISGFDETVAFEVIARTANL